MTAPLELTSDPTALESVGTHFSVAAMLEVRDRTRAAIAAIAARIRPGMAEEEGLRIAKAVLKDMGLRRGWHEIVVRFGRNTVHEFGVPSEPGVILAENDIFLVDIGPMLNNIEGDAGDTFVVGADEEMERCRHDVVALWHGVHRTWQTDGLTGRELYRFAEAEAASLGWELNLKRMSGHRIGDFPHRHRYDGLLSEVDINPGPYLWILEMHIRHPSRPFGAFYEDMMLSPEG